MSKEGQQISAKLKSVLNRLVETQRDAKTRGSGVEDDTLLQKLHTHIHQQLVKSKNGPEWARSVGLTVFVQDLLDPTTVNTTKDSARVALTLKILASLISVEENFDAYIEGKVLCHFLVLLPSVRSDPTLASAALILVQAILKHKPGLYWLIKNGVWEKMLLPCLRSPSIFVQREGIKVITSFVLALTDTQHFGPLLKDLYMISDKLGELRRHLGQAEGEDVRQSKLCVLRVIKQIHFQSLGREAVYSQICSVGDCASRLVTLLQTNIPATSVTLIADVLLLNIMHKFQDRVVGYGLVEQFLVDGLSADTIALTRLLLQKGHLESFLRASVNIHQYWSILVHNLRETKNIDLTSVETLLHIVTSLQMTTLLVLYQSCLNQLLKLCPEKATIMARWNDEILSRIKIKDDIKADARKLEGEMVEALEKDESQAVKMAVVTVSGLTEATSFLNQTCAVTIFQGLVLLLGSHTCPDSPIRSHVPLQRVVIGGLRVLVEKFNIDWRKCYVSVCLMGMLCDMVKIQGITTQVKVIILKAMNSCITRFIPPVMSMLVNSEKQEYNSIEMMGQVLTIYLGDMEWEVRDSALELLITCMKLAREKYPYFVDWLLRYGLDRAVVVALGDVEGYVRASALTLLATIVSIDKKRWSPVCSDLSSRDNKNHKVPSGCSKNKRVWEGLDGENLAHRGLWAVMNEGESPVRAAAITLVHQLFLAGKYSEEEVEGLVVRVMQRAADDPDDEVRLAALEFMHSHILWALNRHGMVDGEFPSVTFSRGKIIKLDKNEVKNRVCSILTWICECGYLCSLLTCLKDLVTPVRDKTRDIFCFLYDLITRYEIQLEGSKRSESVTPAPRRGGVQVVQVAGHDVAVGRGMGDVDSAAREDEIDRTISDILAASSLHTVNMIKRPCTMALGGPAPPPPLLLTLDDVPPANTPLPLATLLTNIHQFCCCTDVNEEERQRVSDFLSLLDDILLEGGDTQPTHLDDQHLRDCY